MIWASLGSLRSISPLDGGWLTSFCISCPLGSDKDLGLLRPRWCMRITTVVAVRIIALRFFGGLTLARYDRRRPLRLRRHARCCVSGAETLLTCKLQLLLLTWTSQTGLLVLRTSSLCWQCKGVQRGNPATHALPLAWLENFHVLHVGQQ